MGFFKRTKKFMESSELPTLLKAEVAVKEEKIDSKVIGEDMRTSFEEMMKQMEIQIEGKGDQKEKLQERRKALMEANIHLVEKDNKLKSLGFVNTPTTRVQLAELEERKGKINAEILEINKKLEAKKAIDDMVKKYALKYPGYKFISRDVMIDVMRRYNLFVGDTFMYGREIPDTALDIISGFEKEIEESTMLLQVYRWGSMSYYGNLNTRWVDKPNPRKYEGMDAVAVSLMASAEEHMSRYESVVGSFEVSKLKIIAPADHFIAPQKIGRTKIEGGVGLSFHKEGRMVSLNFSKHNKKMAELRKIEDPIAVLDVEGGYIVLHAWDKEAEIPEIKNPIAN